MNTRNETITLPGCTVPVRILHISDVHFSRSTTDRHNDAVIEQILTIAENKLPVNWIAMTGDLVSRHTAANTFSAAKKLMCCLRRYAPVLYTMGNHEMDLSEAEQSALLNELRSADITILNNQKIEIDGLHITGLTLPQTVYKQENGSYRHLTPITRQLLTDCIGTCASHPQILLAHSPIGFPAYAQWGADLVLSGHVHGGIVRVGNTGLLSPERRFLPTYTKGLYHDKTTDCLMNVSAGIGKFRLNNPAEVVCIELVGSNV